MAPSSKLPMKRTQPKSTDEAPARERQRLRVTSHGGHWCVESTTTRTGTGSTFGAIFGRTDGSTQ